MGRLAACERSSELLARRHRASGADRRRGPSRRKTLYSCHSIFALQRAFAARISTDVTKIRGWGITPLAIETPYTYVQR